MTDACSSNYFPQPSKAIPRGQIGHIPSPECEIFSPLIRSQTQRAAMCYDGPPEWVIPRFWRDLLIMAIIQKAVVEAFKAYRQECQDLKEDKPYHDKVMLRELLEVTRDPDNPQRIEDEYGIGFQDEWHTNAMKAALPELRALLN